MCAGVWWGNLKRKDRLETLSIKRIILKLIFKGLESVCTGLIWLTGTRGKDVIKTVMNLRVK
jgi:hypothetical protein